MSTIVLVTGHIGSGKTHLLNLPLFDSFIKYDIADLYDDYRNSQLNPQDYMGDIFNKLQTLVFNNLFKNRKVILEMIGNEVFFSDLKRLFFKSTFRLVQIELCKITLQKALADLRIRNYNLNNEDKSMEELILRDSFGQRFNNDAELFFSTSDGLFELEKLNQLLKGRT